MLREMEDQQAWQCCAWGCVEWAVLHVQILAAEKAGSWSAALTLYEQALKNEGSMTSAGARDALKPGSAGQRSMVGHVEGGLSAARRGHLNCLLQLGHLQALLAGVDGWMTRCAGMTFPRY